MTDSEKLRGLLSAYTGSTEWHRHWANRSCTYTDGVRAFAEQAGGGAFWFLDIIMTEPKILQGMRQEGFVIVALNVKETKASITVKRDTDCPNIFERFLKFTDCPEGEWRFYFADDVLMLPREY